MKSLTKTFILSVLSFIIFQATAFSQSTVNEHSIKFLNDQTATLVGEDGVILATTDGGITWNTQNSGITDVLNGNAVVDANVSFAVGENGVILKTTDGGNTWVLAESGTVEHLKKIVIKETNIIVCGEHGTIVVSHDMGNTWTKLAALTTNNLNYVTVAGQSILAVGDNSSIYTSTDNGDTWNQITFTHSPATFESVAALDENNYIIVGDNNTLIRTTDNGTSWTGIGLNTGTINLREVTLFNSNDGVVVGDRGLVLTTTDGGTSWQSSSILTNTVLLASRNLNSVAFSSLTNGITIGEQGTHFYSADGGKTWTEVLANRPKNLAVLPKINKVALNQNYPNPFNPSTVISYSLPFNSSVTVKIFDMLGREVKTLVNGYQNAGNYSVRFDGANLASGIYFYSLKVNGGNKEFSQTMRMILTK